MTRLKKIGLIVSLTALVSGGAFAQIKDGIYWGESQASYTSEPYWGMAFVEYKDGKIKETNFYIVDRGTKDAFDLNYVKHFANNPEYVQQVKNDWAGVLSYRAQFTQKKDLAKVDAVSGATWSFNIFKSAMKIALDKAKASEK
jgi:major membrane immunogen (membrane-anchored lipoprotein)